MFIGIDVPINTKGSPMTCTDRQVKMMKKQSQTHSLTIAALKTGMSVKTARKYKKSGKLPSECQKERNWKTRPDPFEEVWPEMVNMLNHNPGLQSKTLMAYLIKEYPKKYHECHLRTLQRKVKYWRATQGPDRKEIIFPQFHVPGEQSQSDYTVMDSLEVCIGGKVFPHLLFHWMLPYSGWETVSICFSESFNTLQQGYEKAVWELGAVAIDHRTDNLTAATHALGSKRVFNDKWDQLLSHYGVTPSRNNPGKSHENGSVEKSHHTLKTAIDQQLMLRGHRNFKTQSDYEDFVKEIVKQRNEFRLEALAEEMCCLKSLPEKPWYAPDIRHVRVSPCSTVRIHNTPYSVPSRLISEQVRAVIFPERIEIYYGQYNIQTMVRNDNAVMINYRHMIKHLLRKPKAFLHYKYRDELFPQTIFRWAYDQLIEQVPNQADKMYLNILQAAMQYGETSVVLALELLAKENLLPTEDEVISLAKPKSLPLPAVYIRGVDPKLYNQLVSFKSTGGDQHVL